MLRIAVSKNSIKVTSEQMQELAELTDGYSGSDIANLTNDALMAPVRNLEKVRLWEEVIDNGVTKYSPTVSEKGGKNYFKGDMQELKTKGLMIYLETKF